MKKQVIEFGGEAVGVVVPDRDHLKFMAVKYEVWDLDAKRFGSADEARAAIGRLMASQSVIGPPTAAAAAA
ncbi:hypothetical protein [Pararhizobium sp.]|uniref:hypothetical protein n=1 Tax=Pararhizobium sp. TaxID=1977563 RepID=UPI00271E4AC7|nr:hypothetical protein [Pararhizobium sp.]MDO9418199.1 hypothetical protein [Pararhizobium sp.]